MRSQTKIFSTFKLFFLSVTVLSFLFPQTTLGATLCTYETPNGQPGCEPVASRQACLDNCSLIPDVPCAPIEFESCERYLQGQRANQQNRQHEQEVQANLEKRREETGNSCVCRPGDSSRPLQEVSLTKENCVDGERDDMGTVYFSCQYVSKEEAKKLLGEDFNQLRAGDDEAERLRNPVVKYSGQIRSLNKLNANSPEQVIGLVIRTATGIMGSIALLMCIYGGFLWMTAAGNASQTEKAQNVLFWGALGMFVIFGSYALIKFIFEAASPINTD